jgi:hypothetical protein
MMSAVSREWSIDAIRGPVRPLQAEKSSHSESERALSRKKRPLSPGRAGALRPSAAAATAAAAFIFEGPANW